jgi:hypothetical protein
LKAEYHGSPTGRVSNGLYDVVHFDVIMDVDAEMVPMVMSELSRERFITVRRIDNLMAVDSALEQVQGYFYGNRPVVRLTLACEALFLREWTKPLMPTGVKRILAGVQETQR